MVSGSFAFRISRYVYNLIRNHYLLPTLFYIFKEGGGEEERDPSNFWTLRFIAPFMANFVLRTTYANISLYHCCPSSICMFHLYSV